MSLQVDFHTGSPMSYLWGVPRCNLNSICCQFVGVKPDIEIPTAQAFYSAYAAALKSLLPKAADSRSKKRIEDALAHAEKAEPEPANYTRP
ncbi:hypothetical protein [Solimicrobium silvestre]|uniref:hypothetical protein n=1 Tax=Solimicrobium silvestre TaxID=2099400 RepID=UPI000CFC02B3|nr:hypothetical protein [Solimicrobium silvestre]